MQERLSRGRDERLLTPELGAAGLGAVPGVVGRAGESCIRLQCQTDIRGLGYRMTIVRLGLIAV
jgi:hypothetical protein